MIQQKSAHLGLAVLGVAAGIGLLTTTEASAKGCNGVVNQLEWGCAAWDNNNGPQFPHYKKPASPTPAVKAQPVAATPKPVISPNSGAGIVASGGGNALPKNGIVASGGGNALPKNANGIVASGGGNAVRK